MRYSRLFLVSLCVLLLATGLFAQDETPTAIPTETATLTELPTGTPIPSATPLPTETATLAPTLTPSLTTTPTVLLTETPTLTATAISATSVDISPTLESISATATLMPTEVISSTATQTPVEVISATAVTSDVIVILPAVTATATASPTLTALPAISTTATATATITSTPTAIPFIEEPTLMTLVTDDFEVGELFLWTASENWSFAQVEGGTVLHSTAGIDPLTFAQTNMLDVSATIRVQLNGGSMAMHLRESAIGRYSVTLNANGIIALYRDTTLLEGTTLAPLGTDWHTLTLSAIGDIVRVTVDDVTLLAVQDANALPAGGLSMASVDGSPVRVDDFVLAVPEIEQVAQQAVVMPTDMPTALPTFTPFPSEAELNARQMSSQSMMMQQQQSLISFPISGTAQLIDTINTNCTIPSESVELNLTNNIYTLVSGTEFIKPPYSNLGFTGLPPIKCDLTINGNGSTITRDTSPTTPAFRIMTVDEGASLTLKDITISNGLLDSGGEGAGIYSYQGRLTLDNTIVEYNKLNYQSSYAIRGAGISIFYGELNILNSTIQDNENLGSGSANVVRGGGIAIDNSSGVGFVHIILNTTIRNNKATHGGGGIYIEAAWLNIQNSVIENNSSTDSTPIGGGGILSGGNGEIIISGTTIQNNQTSGDGGGVKSSKSLAITNSIFQNNDAVQGGAIYAVGNTSVNQSCILGNSDNIETYDVFSHTSSPPLDATGNWWGHTSGPSGDYLGAGDSANAHANIVDFIDYDPSVPNDCLNGFSEPPVPPPDCPVLENIYANGFDPLMNNSHPDFYTYLADPNTSAQQSIECWRVYEDIIFLVVAHELSEGQFLSMYELTDIEGNTYDGYLSEITPYIITSDEIDPFVGVDFDINYLFARVLINGMSDKIRGQVKGQDPIRYFLPNYTETFGTNDGENDNWLNVNPFCGSDSRLLKNLRGLTKKDFCADRDWYRNIALPALLADPDVQELYQSAYNKMIPQIRKAITDHVNGVSDPTQNATTVRPANRRWETNGNYHPEGDDEPAYVFETFVGQLVQLNWGWRPNAEDEDRQWYPSVSLWDATNNKLVPIDTLRCSDIRESLPQAYMRHLRELYNTSVWTQLLNGESVTSFDIYTARFGINRPSLHLHSLYIERADINSDILYTMKWLTFRFERDGNIRNSSPMTGNEFVMTLAPIECS